MEAPKLTIEELEKAITPIARKYGWTATALEEGLFEVTISDGAHEAKGAVDSVDDLEDIVRRLEKNVDEQEYPVIG